MKLTNYSSVFSRMLYDSPLHTVKGKIIFALIFLLVLYPALNAWIDWRTSLENGWIVLFGMLSVFTESLLGLIFDPEE